MHFDFNLLHLLLFLYGLVIKPLEDILTLVVEFSMLFHLMMLLDKRMKSTL
jgi:hypothetical protein